MNISSIMDLCIPIVIIACLIAGYCIKHIKWLDSISNHYIPTILALLGAILGCIATGGVSLESAVYGALSGLVSIGLHQTFKTIIAKNKGDGQDDIE